MKAFRKRAAVDWLREVHEHAVEVKSKVRSLVKLRDELMLADEEDLKLIPLIVDRLGQLVQNGNTDGAELQVKILAAARTYMELD